MGFPNGTVIKNSPANVGDARDAGSVPGLGRSPGVGNGNPLQHSCLENSTDRGAWRTTVYGVTMYRTRQHTHNPTILIAHKRCSINNHCYEAQNTVIWEQGDESRIVRLNGNNCEGLTMSKAFL